MPLECSPSPLQTATRRSRTHNVRRTSNPVISGGSVASRSKSGRNILAASIPATRILTSCIVQVVYYRMIVVRDATGNKEMRKQVSAIVPTQALLLAVALGLQVVAHAQEPKVLYASRAPLAQYLMLDQNAEITLGRSAAPASISRDSTVMVLTPRGYEMAQQGKNGFVCLVDRSWMSPFDSVEFWNPKNRSPACFNPPAVRSVLPYELKRTEWVLAGFSKTQIMARIRAAIAHKELPVLEPGAMCYMMSPNQYLGDASGHYHPHLMFYSTKSDGADWGANLPGSPVLVDPISLSANSPDPFTIFIVPVLEWSDGAPAAAHAQ
jgi:hypothetical protein